MSASHARISAALMLLTMSCAALAADPPPRRIVIVAGPKSHGPEGNRIHDYPWSARLLEAMLRRSNIADRVQVDVIRDGWPNDAELLERADAVMVISDGRDGDLFREAPFLESAERVAEVQKLMDRGCGLLTFHFSTFAPDRYADQVLDWTGGYFDWEEGGERKWYSAIETHDTDVQPVNSGHPVLQGVSPFRMHEEFYFNLRFEQPGRATDAADLRPFSTPGGVTTPLLTAPALPGRDARGKTVAWARERKSGGRGFGTTCGHFYDNWKNSDFRKLILNALVWAAHGEVPAGGVEAPYLTRRQICEILNEPFDPATAGDEVADAVAPTEQAAAEPERIRVLLLAGNEAHEWHNWKKTTPAIAALLEVDPRVTVDVIHDSEELSDRLRDRAATDAPASRYDVLIQNYANWQDPTPLSEPARQALVSFVSGGGGFVVIHFANGAWHYSLPNAGASDWPEYRRIVRRVWNHDGPENQRSSHDPFRQFTVDVTSLPSDLTKGLKAFQVQDELYFSQQGTEPIEPLLTARSVMTRRAEPLAWTSSYGQGRVFQMLLGHSEKTYEVFEPRELLRRSVAWCAQKQIRPRTPKEDTAFHGAVSTQPLVTGKFGLALNAHVQGVFVQAADRIRRAPLTLDAWVQLSSADNFNIIAASEEKSSAEHWELYSYAGSGVLSAYLPGHGGEYKSSAALCDAQWHHVTMILEPARLRLLVDAQLALDRPIDAPFATTGRSEVAATTPLAIGRLVEDGLGCAGLIDEVRIRGGAVEEPDDLASAPVLDDATRALWRFDALQEGGRLADERHQFPATFERTKPVAVNAAPGPTALPQQEGVNHWGKELVGFDWKEGDSVDGRWQQTQVGTFLASVVPVDGEPTEKGLSVKVGEEGAGAVLYDTARGQMRAAWRHGFLKFFPARYGIIQSPAPDGEFVFSTGKHFGFGSFDETGGEANEFHFAGMWRNGRRVVLEWKVGSATVRESPWLESPGGVDLIVRSLEFSRDDRGLSVRLSDRAAAWEQVSNGNLQLAVARQGDEAQAWGIRCEKRDAELRSGPRGVSLHVPPRTQPVDVELLIWHGAADDLGRFAAQLAARPASPPIADLAQPGPPQWTTPIETRGVIAAESNQPYVIDTVTLPFNNPYRALFFVAGHDFLTPDAAMVCTVHGDVWLVQGLAGDWNQLSWKRFATGLFQPLGLVIRKRLTEPPQAAAGAAPSLTRDFDILVLGRNQITRLFDLNADDEADFYEVFHEQVLTSPGGHDFVTCLETDAIGRLYYLNAKEGLIRVSPDGRFREVIATGFRNPNGLGVGPNGEMTIAPQEGEWTPASGIFEVQPGSYGGFGGPQVKSGRPLGYDPPLCWIPRRQDNSSGGQVWVTSDRWGPLQGKLLHLSYGQCTVQLVLREYVAGTGQAGTVPLDPVFESGICRGRFSPFDGQLYVSGLRGWTTAATQDGCFQRLRYTGRPANLPLNLATLTNGLMVTFSDALDREIAEDPDSYFAERWNITYREQYGSPEFKVSNPREEGRDPVEIESATLLEDGQTVFLEMEHVEPVSQFVLSYTLTGADGRKFSGSIAETIHAVRNAPFDPARITRRPRKGQLTIDEQQHQRPGVKWNFRTPAEKSAGFRLSRLAVLPEEPAQRDGQPVEAVGEGFLYVPIRGDYRFRLASGAPAELQIDDRTVVSAGTPGSATATAVALHKGYNRFRIVAKPTGTQPFSLSWLWSSDKFDEEPVPPDALSAVLTPADEARLEGRKGAALLLTHHCSRCHVGPAGDGESALARGAPSLEGVGDRLQVRWMESWIFDPGLHGEDVTMPALLRHLPMGPGRQAAADLAVYLSGLRETADRATPQTPDAAPSARAIEQGEELYEDLGCIACHRLTPVAEKDRFARRSLADAAVKYRPGALAAYLKAPQMHFPATSMPDFHLSDDESAALASYVQARAAALVLPEIEPDGDAARGRELFAALGCAQCHRIQDAAELPPATGRDLAKISDAALDRGCLAAATDSPAPLAANGRPVPQFRLSDRDTGAIKAALALNAAPIQRGSSEDCARLMAVLRCAACHDRDDRRSPRMEILADEGSRGLSPEQLPSLTWTGDRLHAEWIAKFIGGREPRKPRIWLKARMPSFPAYAESLAAGLAAEHGHGREESASRSPDRSLAAAGAELIQSTGLDCRQCHGLGSQPPTGDRQTLLAPGVNFEMVPDRMRREFYDRWMLDPPRFDPNTRMPKLAPDGQHTKVTKFFDGDARQQFRAIWAFLEDIGPVPSAGPPAR